MVQPDLADSERKTALHIDAGHAVLITPGLSLSTRKSLIDYFYKLLRSSIARCSLPYSGCIQ